MKFLHIVLFISSLQGMAYEDVQFSLKQKQQRFIGAIMNNSCAQVEKNLQDDLVHIDLKKTDEKGRTPLAIAVELGHESIISLLIKAGAEVNVEDFEKKSPLYRAVTKGYVNIALMLLKAGANNKITLPTPPRTVSVIHIAVENENDAMVRALLSFGLPIEATFSFPLIVAAERGSLAMVNLLLESGANPNAANSVGDTALSVSIAKGYDLIVRRLIVAGAVPKDDDLYNAATSGHLAVVEVLLEYRVASASFLDSLKSLLIFPRLKPNSKGDSPLHGAAKQLIQE